MIYIIDFCNWPLWLLWLLPFLLGLILGCLFCMWRSKWKSKYEELEGKYSNLQGNLSKTEADLKACNHNTAMHDGDMATANGRVKEMQVQLDAANANKGNVEDDGKYAELEAKYTGLTKQHADCDADLKACQSKCAGLEGDLVTANASISSAASNVASMAAGFAAGSVTNETKDEKPKVESTPAPASKYAFLKNSNLQIIEGIGPKMESVLHDAGIKTWSELSKKSVPEIRTILDSYGGKYKIINPESWPMQAGLAADAKWDEMIQLQKQLDGGVGNSATLTDSKLEKLIGVKIKGGFGKYKKDDLKIVEGIGPKISELLNNAGVTTWSKLSETSVEKIQEVLDSAGSKFKLANPRTWAQQAGLAAAEKWSELKALQDELDGGV